MTNPLFGGAAAAASVHRGRHDGVGMPSTMVLIRRAIRVARSLYGRWRVLPEPDRERIAPLAENAKEKALSLRGASDPSRAEADLRGANETLAAALVETAEADPEVGEEEVRRLRDDLRRELERLSEAEIKASRGPGAVRDH